MKSIPKLLKTPASAPRMPKGNDEGGKVVGRNLLGMKPDAAQACCVPTPAEPVRMHVKMAGGC